MKIVIDVPKHIYEHIKEVYEHSQTVEATYSYIYHGTPLPEGGEEINLGIDIGDEVVNEWGVKGVVVGITTDKEAGVMLSLLMKNHKVPQLVQASRYKTKTGRHFPQIKEILDAILP